MSYWEVNWLSRNQEITPIFFLWRCGPTGAMTSLSFGFLDHTRRCTTEGRIALDKWSARRRDLYVTTHNTDNRETSMPPQGLEPTISAGERLQNYDLDISITGIGVPTLHNAKCLYYQDLSQNMKILCYKTIQFSSYFNFLYRNMVFFWARYVYMDTLKYAYTYTNIFLISRSRCAWYDYKEAIIYRQ